MSRHNAFSNTDSKQHPATLKLTWDNTNANFKAYDKTTKTTTNLSLPLKFMVIDSYSTITGWDDKSGTSFYSNEVKNVSSEQLIVKNGIGTVMAGLYNDIKLGLEEIKAKYTTSLYVVFADGTIGNIILAGKNNFNWFEFRKASKGKLTQNWIGIGNPQAFKKGSITWHEPEFKILDEINAEDGQKADAGYDAIQEYKTPCPTETTIGNGAGTIEDKKAFLDSVRTITMESTEDDGLELGY
jgi:hypothetical protein